MTCARTTATSRSVPILPIVNLLRFSGSRSSDHVRVLVSAPAQASSPSRCAVFGAEAETHRCGIKNGLTPGISWVELDIRSERTSSDNAAV